MADRNSMADTSGLRACLTKMPRKFKEEKAGKGTVMPLKYKLEHD